MMALCCVGPVYGQTGLQYFDFGQGGKVTASTVDSAGNAYNSYCPAGHTAHQEGLAIVADDSGHAIAAGGTNALDYPDTLKDH